MGGGVILLAVMVNLLPMTTAMIYHGIIQFFANGFRAGLNWKSISVKIMTYYLVGSIIGSLFLFQLVYYPNKAHILIFVGLITLFGPYFRFIHIDVTTPFGGIFCGLVVSWLNTLAGASGPLLNMFFMKSSLTRQEVVATKSATQTLAHVIKVLFYSGVVGAMTTVPWGEFDFVLVFLCALTFLGGWIGKGIMERMSEENFRRYGFLIISIFGLLFIIQGVYLLA